MFIQAFHGPTDDPDALRERFDAWRRDQAAKAEGWLGTTAGVTDDGTLVAVVRFDSEDAARRNSDRPEQGGWWADTEPLFSGPVEFRDYPRAEPLMEGGSDEAGFAQVIQGRATDLDRLLELQQHSRIEELREEIVGGSYGWDGDGNVIETVCFTSEEEAREGERRMPEAPDDVRAVYEEYLGLLADVRYFDLRRPWLWSAL